MLSVTIGHPPQSGVTYPERGVLEIRKAAGGETSSAIAQDRTG